MSDVKKYFGQKVKEYRQERGLNQQQFGDLTGLTRASVLNIESGRQSPTIDRMIFICQILNCTPNDLLPAPGKLQLIATEELVPVTKFKKVVTYKINLNT